MQDVEFYRWWITDRITGRPRLTSWLMPEEDALARYPGAIKDPASREVRSLPQTSEELAQAHQSLHTRVAAQRK